MEGHATRRTEAAICLPAGVTACGGGLATKKRVNVRRFSFSQVFMHCRASVLMVMSIGRGIRTAQGLGEAANRNMLARAPILATAIGHLRGRGLGHCGQVVVVIGATRIVHLTTKKDG